MFLRQPSPNIQQELVEKLWIHLMASDENYGMQNEQQEQGRNGNEDTDTDTDTDSSVDGEEDSEITDKEYEYDKESPLTMYGGGLLGLMKQISVKGGDCKSNDSEGKQVSEQTKSKEKGLRSCKVLNNCKNDNKSKNKYKNQLKEVNKVSYLKTDNVSSRKSIIDNQRSHLKKNSRLHTEKVRPHPTQKSPNKFLKSSNSLKLCSMPVPPSRYVSSKAPPLQRVWRPSGKTEIRVHNCAPSNSGISAQSKSLTKVFTKQQSLDTAVLAKQKKHISKLWSSERTYSLDIPDHPVLHKLDKKISRTHSLDISDHSMQTDGAVSHREETNSNNCHNRGEKNSNMQVSKILLAQAENRPLKGEKETESPKATTVCKVVEDPNMPNSSSSNIYTFEATDTGLGMKVSEILPAQKEYRSAKYEKGAEFPEASEVLEDQIRPNSSPNNMHTIEEIDPCLLDNICQSPVSQQKESELPNEKEDNSLQTENESVLCHPTSFNVRLEACLKDAVVDVLGGLPEDWLHSPENTAEVFLFFMSALESFPRPHYTLKQVLSAIIYRHENTACGKPDKGEASCVKTPHLLLYVGVKLCSVNAQQHKDVCDIKQEQDVKLLLLKLLTEIRRCEGHFDRLMLCILLGSRAPGRGCGWYCETEEEEEKVRDLNYIFENIGQLENCSVVDLVSEPIWSLGSSPVVVAALADAPGLLLVLLQHGAGESQQKHLTYKADPIKLSIAFVVRKLASIQHVHLATELQPPKPGLDLLQHTVNTPTLMCLRYLLRTVPWVPAKYLNQHVTGSIRDVALVLPGVYLGLEPPTLKHLARCATRSSLRLHGFLPYGLEEIGLPATLKDYVNLLK